LHVSEGKLVLTERPGGKVPIQYLAAESELLWDNKYEARPKFRKLVKLLTGAPEVESEILEGGAHNFEFSLSVSKLWELRRNFVERVVSDIVPIFTVFPWMLMSFFQAKRNSVPNGVNGTNGVHSAAFTSIPTLDYSETASSATRPHFLAALKDAIVNVGFFYLKNTRVPDDVQRDFTEQSIGLFNLPLEKKLEIEMVHSKHFLGYARLGQEVTALKNDHREQFDVSQAAFH
jgi:hypothetical protein